MKEIDLLLMVLACSVSFAAGDKSGADTNSCQISYQAFEHLPQRFLFVKQDDLRPSILAGKPFLDLIEGKKCLVVFRAVELKNSKRQTVDVSRPKTVAQVLKEIGIGKEEIQIRVFKKNEIAQSDRAKGLRFGRISDLIVEPGDILVDVLDTSASPDR